MFYPPGDYKRLLFRVPQRRYRRWKVFIAAEQLALGQLVSLGRRSKISAKRTNTDNSSRSLIRRIPYPEGKASGVLEDATCAHCGGLGGRVQWVAHCSTPRESIHTRRDGRLGVDRTEGWRRMTSRIKGLELPKLPFMICGVLIRGEWVFPRFFLDVGLHPSVGQIIGL